MRPGRVRGRRLPSGGGGRRPGHAAAGWVPCHVLRGALTVQTPDALHALGEGKLLSLAPGVLHDVEALEASDMLLGIYPEAR